jgi:putative pyruvate formate lyase activating enzyme
VGKNGSGTVFFTHCNLMCAFCQNYDISHEGHGQEVSDAQLAQIMLALQGMGCHNINFVSPSHVVPQILAALDHAVPNGLTVPLVYNTGAYDRPETLALLEDVIDIYMPDFKFWEPSVAAESCDAADYPERARQALAEMHRQVGDLIINREGLAVRGLIVRHLVLPEGLAGTGPIMEFIARRLSPNTYVNIMSQYRPCGRAHAIAGLSRGISSGEFKAALDAAAAAGLTRLDRPGRHFLVR